jgi:hypothetical protein
MRSLSFVIFSAVLVAGCAQNDDPTFMKLCEASDGTFTYPAGDAVASATCPAPAELVWDHVPLTVSIVPELSDYSASLDEAILFWNRDLGFALFRRATPTENVDVSVISGSASDPGLAATSHHRVGALFALVEIRKPGDVVEMQYVLAHELGHVVDLAHDPGQSSIMHSTIELTGLDTSMAGPDAPDDFPVFFVTNNDHNALTKLYKP